MCVVLSFFSRFFLRDVLADHGPLLLLVLLPPLFLLVLLPLPATSRRSCARGNSSRRGGTGGVFVEHGGDKEGREEGESEASNDDPL